MLRYIALVWDPRNGHAVGQAAAMLHTACAQPVRWRRVIDTAGLAVLFMPDVAQPDPQIFPIGCGTILGPLFLAPDTSADESVPPPARLTPQEAHRVIFSEGRELISDFWGDYVAIFRAWNSSTIHVLRGPAATLGCLHMRRDDVDMYFSHLESASPLYDADPPIHWRALARSFLAPEWPGETHLHGVREVVPGYCDQIFEGRTRTTRIWSPAKIASEPYSAGPGEAARMLRTVTRACIRARAAPHPRVLVALSGGLDSSIVLSCLTGLRPLTQMTCLTQFVEGTDSDERAFARASSAHARCELIEHSRHEVPDLRTALYTERLALNPGLRMPSVDRVEADHALQLDASAVFFGHGGDELHCRTGYTRYISDFIRIRGFGRGLGELLLNAAYFEGATVWEVLARAIYGAIRPRRVAPIKELIRDISATSLLHPDVLADLIARPDPSSPYEDSRITLPPGRAFHLTLLCARRNFDSPFDWPGDPVRVPGLLSQPLIQLCLRIPTWYQTADRRDRALARRAFAHDIAPEVRDRRDKGGAESVAGAIIEHNRAWIRELLLEGIVAQSGILNRARLEACLSDFSDSEVTSSPIFSVLGAEVWSRALSRFTHAHDALWMLNDKASEDSSSSPNRSM